MGAVVGLRGSTPASFFEVGKPVAGDTVLVTAASGAVGAVVGQLGKINGCRVIGTAGTPEKVAYVEHELGFDACIDYLAWFEDAYFLFTVPIFDASLARRNTNPRPTTYRRGWTSCAQTASTSTGTTWAGRLPTPRSIGSRCSVGR